MNVGGRLECARLKVRLGREAFWPSRCLFLTVVSRGIASPMLRLTKVWRRRS